MKTLEIPCENKGRASRKENGFRVCCFVVCVDCEMEGEEERKKDQKNGGWIKKKKFFPIGEWRKGRKKKRKMRLVFSGLLWC
jgi:hypothetical protein